MEERHNRMTFDRIVRIARDNSTKGETILKNGIKDGKVRTL
jgi:hypothetical protein